MEDSIQLANDKEILIRGRILQLSAKIESILAKIILVSKMEDLQAEAVKFKGMMLHGKIEYSQKTLEQYHPTIYERQKSVFEDLLKLKDFRNKIAHCEITWNYDDLSYYTVWDISISEDNIQFYYPFNYTINETFERIEEFKQVGASLVKILIEIQEKFNAQYPGFFQI